MIILFSPPRFCVFRIPTMTVNYFSNNIMLNRKKRTISYASSFSQRRNREKTEHVIFSDISHLSVNLPSANFFDFGHSRKLT